MDNDNDNENHTGRPARYLTIKMFNKFIHNDFFHLRVETRVALIIGIAILTILLSLLVKLL